MLAPCVVASVSPPTSARSSSSSRSHLTGRPPISRRVGMWRQPTPFRSSATMRKLAEEMTCWPVSTRIGNVKINDPSLIEPVVLAG
jgi:hypothetical protein